MAGLGACQNDLLRLLPHQVPRNSSRLRQAHHQVDVVVEGDLGGSRRENVRRRGLSTFILSRLPRILESLFMVEDLFCLRNGLGQHHRGFNSMFADACFMREDKAVAAVEDRHRDVLGVQSSLDHVLSNH